MLSQQHPKKLFLLDAFALIYRAYFAFIKNPRINSKGLNTSAMFGMVNTIMEVLEKEKPTHIAIAFDTAGPTDRHVEFEAYKAHREAMPEDLAKAIPYIYKLVEAFNIPILVLEGYEADDIIGTIAKQAEKQGFLTYMMTPDKDYAQLVSENIFMFKPARAGGDAEVWGIPEVLKKFEIANVDQVRDLLGLWGDSADNIPGIPGVGEKTAKQLIAQFGSVENMIANVDQIQGKLRDKVATNADSAILSKRLASIILDVPLDVELDALAVKGVDKDLMRDLFAELEFRNLSKRVLGEELFMTTANATAVKEAGKNQHQNTLFDMETEIPIIELPEAPSVLKTIADVPHNYELIQTIEECKALADKLAQQRSFCFDTETTALETFDAELVGMSFAYVSGEAYYVAVPADRAQAQAIVEVFRPVLENPAIEKVGQNIKYDFLVLMNYNIRLAGPLFDTMLAHYLIDADSRHGMDYMAETLLGYRPVSITELIGKKGKEQGNMRDVPVEQVKEYAAEDADITLQLKEYLSPLLDKGNARKLATEVENPLIYVLADMERDGIKLDVPVLNDYSKQLEREIAETEDKIYTLSGERFNIGSPRQLGEVLFEKMKLDEKAKKTKTGQYQTGEDILQNLLTKHEVIQHILDYRQYTKLKSTYVDALPRLVNAKTGKLHSNFRQAVAATGRLSSDNPNLQNIPIKTDKGREIRKAFIPSNAENVLISADYSQIELRIIAEISKDEGMLDAFAQGHDIHKATAAKVYGIPLEEVTSTQRRNAKAVNFGIIYGQSAFGLAQGLGIPRKEAAEIIENYFTQYAGVKRYMADTVSFARKHGFVETILGRRRYLRDINSANAVVRGFAERNAINAPIQGSAADMIKVAMINIHQALREQGLGTKMVLQVHDELVFDTPKNEVEIIKPLIVKLMRDAIPMQVPILAETGSGVNWLEAH